MLINFLEKKNFDVREFCNELDKRELLFLFFLNNQDTEDIERLDSVNLDIDSIFQIAERTVGKKYAKILSQDVHDAIIEDLESSNIGKWIYKEVYLSAFDENHVHLNSKIFMIERFVKMTMIKKIEKVQELLNSSKRDDISEELTKLLFSTKPNLNTLSLVMFIGKTKKMLEDFYSPVLEGFSENLLVLLFEQFEVLNRNKLENCTKTLKRKEIDCQKLQQDNKKKEVALGKQKEFVKQLKGELKLATDISASNNLKKKQNERIVDEEFIKNAENQKLQLIEIEKVLKELTVDYEKLIKEVDAHKEETARLRTEKNEAQKLSISYKRKIDEFESKTFKTYISEYLEKDGLTQDIVDYLDPILSKYKYDKENVENKQIEVPEQEIQRIEQRVGYVQIENNNHYVKFIDGSKIMIKDMSESIYLGENQFVKVQVDGTFKWVFNFRYEESDRDYQVSEFGSVVYKNGEAHLMKGHWDVKKILKIPANIQLRDNQVVAVNKNMEFIRFYKGIIPNVDYFIDSILAKGHEVFYVLKVFPNGIMVRNIQTSMEEFKVIESKGEAIQEQQIITLDGDKLVKVYFSPKFYTMSPSYKQAQHGVVEHIDGKVFIQKLSGEKVIVNEIPSGENIEDGTVIIVDEFNNFIRVKREYGVTDDTQERKKLLSSNKFSVSKKSYTERIEIKKEVLIVGKITYENSYKMALYRHGYKAEVIDGYEPWVKVKSGMKNKDFIVVVTEFVSHENAWQIKDEEVKNPIIFSEFDGANRILEQIEALDNTGKLLVY